MMWSNSTILTALYFSFFLLLQFHNFLDVALCCVKQQRAGPPLSHYGTSPSLFFFKSIIYKTLLLLLFSELLG
jgi:hypothetical protein